MTELQNNDLVSKLWAASPVEPIQTTQINLSDSAEKVSPEQAHLNEAQSPTNISQENTWVDISTPVENAVNNVEITPTKEPIPESMHTENVSLNNGLANNIISDVPNSSIATPNPVAPVEATKVGSTVPNINPAQINNTWAVAGNSINRVVNANTQKVTDTNKRNPRAEYWKWLASGVLISVWLLVIGLMLFDNWSLLASAANSIKLTNNDTANEVVKMEDALAFWDSVSNGYVDDLIGDSDEEVDDSTLDNPVLDDEDLESDEILENDSDFEDELLDDEKSDEDLNDSIVEETDDTKVVAKNDSSDTSDDEGVLPDNDEKSDDNSAKNKMAWSIVSIFDNMEENSESDEVKLEDSLEEVLPISYEHVDKVEDANWVMSANCNNLHCGDISEANLNDLVLCTEFRQSDKLDDNANRIGSNWICRYKDASELVHIEL